VNDRADLIKWLEAKLVHPLKDGESFVKSGVGVIDTGGKVRRQVYKPHAVSVPCQAPSR